MNLIIDFKAKGYLDDQFKITEKMVTDIETNAFEAPAAVKNFKDEVADIMIKIHSTSIFRVAADERADNVHEAILTPNDNFAKKEFQDLWNKIKVKTVYEVDFDSKELVEKSVAIINKHLEVKKVVIRVTT
jgi:type III restriction enzyme